jgi:enoyl-CoA hydratase/carnithine racemase
MTQPEPCVLASRDARFAVSGVNLGLFCSMPGVAQRAGFSLHAGLGVEAAQRRDFCRRTPGHRLALHPASTKRPFMRTADYPR